MVNLFLALAQGPGMRYHQPKAMAAKFSKRQFALEHLDSNYCIGTSRVGRSVVGV